MACFARLYLLSCSPIVDKCITMYYESLLPAWRTWGLSGGMNAWGKQLAKRKKTRSQQPVLRHSALGGASHRLE